MAGAAREVLSARETLEELAEELAAALASSELAPSVASRRTETAAKLFAVAAADTRRALSLAERWKVATREVQEAEEEEAAALERAREAAAAAASRGGGRGQIPGGGGGARGPSSSSRRRVPAPMTPTTQEPAVIREAEQPASPGTPRGE